ncbi:hypothetical protein MCOR25_009700 [Pyricularia grisea]|nr:hypothetical protein MCOR25_009700 [Pyricularia grisea]
MKQPVFRILCLHGDGTNAAIFAAQARHLARALAPHNIELVHVTAPFECQAGFGVSPFFDDCGPFYRWFPRDDFNPQVDGPSAVAAAVETANDLRYEYGDDRDAFVGILGFSSSAGIVAGILAAQDLAAKRPDLRSDVYYRFRFGVIINGTGMPLQFLDAQEGEYDWRNKPINVPTVAVIGTLDQWESQSRRIVQCFNGEVVKCFEYENDHVVPTDEKQVREIANAIVTVAAVA